MRRKAIKEPGLCRVVFNLFEIVTGDDGIRVLKEQPDLTLIYYRWYVTPHDIDESDSIYTLSSAVPHVRKRLSAPLPTSRNVA